MRNGMFGGAALAVAFLSLGGCGPSGGGNLQQATRNEGGQIRATADRLADRADGWGDRTSRSIDAKGPETQRKIARTNDALARIAAPGIPTDRWIGRWTGVEGLTLDIARDPAAGPAHYRLTNRYTLDEQGLFAGTGIGDTIQFRRPDGDQVLRATDGQSTGLKYLAHKRHCLTVKPGEGYCRD